ncbi:MoxR-like ATPase [Rubrobacter radiotolerans]|uniref:MoxR family ATPase n=1 Tax=Rubrobacter radiotolerans TaxID=42256 RepID=A0A023X3D0_RUBRA|nr:MoxR family ATPase [Rubrobacter radiotolerans]AHY46982.1 MoxR-like ATPase [Rubrobacter radiotolerans]MDX5894388.1 MoxR family ATPase [Rubrobacter radiotolerans]SMC05884.1 MoxR-like ATPase [Rubrobacter radiotolerans DSM 5868]
MRQTDIRDVYRTVRSRVVGRERELTSILAALGAGRDLLLEGPPGTSKSTILREITAHYGIPFFLVEGNADLTPAKLLGYHNPAQVVRHGYRPEDFVFGPLPRAMREGGFLYIEEFNRVPEDTLNALLTAMAEREVTISRVGKIEALPTFRIVGAMNPFDNVGTARISVSIYDRLCRLAMGYQSEGEEREVVRLRTASGSERLIGKVVAITRATRDHPDVRLGSSVRGAIDLVLIAGQLAEIRDVSLNGSAEGVDAVLLEAASLALSSKVSLHEGLERSPEDVIRELVRSFAPAAVEGEREET